MNHDSLQAFLQARQSLFDHRDDYDAACAGFDWPVLGDFNWALDYFDTMARDNHSPALWIVEEDGREEKVSFLELSRRSSKAANWLRELGVRRGERVLLMLGNERPLWEIMLAAMKLGAVVIPATTLLSPMDLADRIERGSVRHIVAGAAHVQKFDGLADGCVRIVVGASCADWHNYDRAQSASDDYVPDAPTRATDPLLLYFTSGTTSKPKLVMHSHQSYPVGHLSTMYWIGLKRGDVHLNISSPGWAKHAWSCLFAPWNAQACVLVYNYDRFDAPSFLKVLQSHGVTTMCAPPTVWRLLIQADLSTAKVALRELVCAGEPLNPEVIDQIRRAWGITIRDGYGQTETTCQIGNSPGQTVQPGSMGRPMPGYRVTLRDADGNEANEGEICVECADGLVPLMVGYADDPAKTREVIRSGSYHTGDVAQIDAQGYLTFVGRTDDVFKSSDYRISPFELESILLEHGGITEAAVVPSPDPVRLSVPKAFVSLRVGTPPTRETALSIFRFVRENMAPYKRIRRLEFAELPKTISGKIQRNALRRMEETQWEAQVQAVTRFREEDFPELGTGNRQARAIGG